MSNVRVTQEQIDQLIENAHIETLTIGDSTTFVCVTLENGFLFTDSSTCVDPANYDIEIGSKICMERIKNRLWELEGYCLNKAVYEQNKELSEINEDKYFLSLIK